jgi:photosystem II stability/assembly factor-like uncharacterized protein
MCAWCALGNAGLAFAAGLPISAGGWSWSNPVPQGETLNAVAFTGARGYAVGVDGTVLRSDDGGVTWSRLASETTDTLLQLQELDANTILVGGYCTLRESTDGGATFRRMSVAASESNCTNTVASFSFVAANTGYVELSDGEILYTDDSGQSFEVRSPPTFRGSPGKIAFISPTTGIGLRGEEIVRTEDGAKTWTKVATAAKQLLDVAFVTPQLAYATGAGDTMLRSTDAGRTWEPRPLVLPPGSPLIELSGISCVDAQNCLITAQRGSAGFLVHTSDGGGSATLIRPSEESGVGPVLSAITAVAYSTPNTAIAVGKQGGVFVSSDNGASFHAPTYRLLEGVPDNERMRLRESGLDAYVRVSQGNEIAATTDGGDSWHRLQLPGAGAVDFAFPTVQLGYAVEGDGTLLKTTTAGRSWAILGSVGAKPSALLAPNEKTVVVIRPGAVVRSTDGGARFTTLNPTIAMGRRGVRLRTRRFSDFDVSDGAEQVGRAIFTFGSNLLGPPSSELNNSILESTDEGGHWRRIAAPLRGEPLYAISFLSASTGYVSCGGWLFFTTNAGHTWKRIRSLGTDTEPLYPPVNMSFSSVKDGYIIVSFGRDELETTVLRTEDAGRTWIPQQLPGIISQVASGGAVDYAVGEVEDAIYSTTHGGRGTHTSRLTLTLNGPHAATSRLHTVGQPVHVSGTLTPAVAGAEITISFREGQSFRWHNKPVHANAHGKFALTIAGIRATTDFVAQWSGTDHLNGAATPAVRITVP